MNVSPLNNLIVVGIVDGLIIAFAIIFFMLRYKSTKQVVSAEVPKQIIETPKAKKQKIGIPIVQEASKPKIIDDGLGLLIEEARKHSIKCSVCGAYVVFYDKGKFKSEGMTAAGVIAHLDNSHKKNGE